ncbi:endonuclease [Saccharothrix algeriensis]|uniref:endonuclease n=1 Tax=Saccharothrix algeriensis TaxID=173560 RepID=UPI00338BFA60
MRKFPWRLSGLLAATATVAATLLAPSTAAGAAPITVAEAIGRQDGAPATVRGYVVGQPTATDTVLRSGFPSDYALALADTPEQTSTSRMLYVQVTSSFRASWGLRGNPGLLGARIDVTGPLRAYFAHPGLTSPTAFAPAGATPPPTTTPPATTTGPGVPGGDHDSTYYRNAVGKSGAALKTALHQIIRTNAKLSYDQVWNALKATDEDPANPANVILLYSGRSQSKSTNGGNGDDWNREHVWAKSHGDFGTATGPGTDLHHLRPEDVSVNANRGNKDFDLGGSAAAEAPGNYTDADSWEPRDAVKGDVARMLFYMAVRYEGGDGFADLEVNDSVGNGSAPRMGRLSVLRQWNAQDPPDAFEKRRNQVIHDTYQHNRNPFIDHPEWVASIWG